MADFKRVQFSMHQTRADLCDAVIDMDHVREWAKSKGYLPHVTRYSNHLWEYLQDNPDVPREVAVGELLLEECANLESAYQHPVTTEEIMELLHPDPWGQAERATAPEPDLPKEFTEKAEALALFMFNLCNGDELDSVDLILNHPSYGPEYYDNYMADADAILRTHPHLLGLETRQEMRLS